jgi:hypothetical protein
MIHKFKALGVAMVAVLAMSAVVASAAQAQFTANSYPTTVTGHSALGNDVFSVDGTSVECTGHFEGTLKEASTSLTVIATYSSCRAFGFASATVDMNGCDYVFYSTGSVDLVCPTGQSVTIQAGNCDLDVVPQTGLKTVDLTNNHPHVDVQATVTGVTVNATQDGFLCPLNGTGHKTATYTQGTAVTVKPVSGGNTIKVN